MRWDHQHALAPTTAGASPHAATGRRHGRVPVARRNLLAEKARLLLSVAGVAFAVLLILLVTSLYRGWSQAGSLFEQIPGDLWLAQAGTSEPLRTSSYLPARSASAVASLP